MDCPESAVERAYAALRCHPKLPSPRGVALEVMRLARSRDSHLSDIARVLEGDPAIVSRLLRVVNSSAYPHARPIVAASEAVAYLGVRMVECIALSFSLMSAKTTCRAFDYRRFWSESLARAVMGRRMAKSLNAGVPDEVFTVGLLSQIGGLAFASVHPEGYNALLLSITCEAQELTRTERELFDIDHNELTARMLLDWGLPAWAAEAVRLQDQANHPDFDLRPQPNRLSSVLWLSGKAACCLLKAFNEDLRLDSLLPQAKRLGMSGQALLEIVTSTAVSCGEMFELFDAATLTDAQIEAIHTEAATLKQRCIAEVR